MRKRFGWQWIAILAVCLAASGARAEEALLHCEKGEFMQAAAEGNGLQYAPDRMADILHVALDVTPDFKQRTVAGKTTIRFVPIGLPLGELRLNAVDLRVSNVESDAKIVNHQSAGEELIITFEKPIAPGDETTVTIAHEAEPQRGLYFRTREMGYKPGDDHLFTQGQPFEARHWFPSFDAPNEKFTSEITCRVPADMVVLANGKKVSEEKDENGLLAVTWLQDQPHPNYLIALCAGYFKKIEEKHGDLEMAFYTPPSYIEQAENSNEGTKEMMEFFEEDIGVKYPWAKYYQVVVDDFVAGGMENTSITILTTRTLFTDDTENIRSSENLVAHELAHQWFGDYVTCKDWSHTWLNEGAATYYAHLYAGHAHGRDEMQYQMFRSLEEITSRTNDTMPIVNKKFDDAMAQFTYRSYDKGGWVLHMLRSQLGDELYRKAIKNYLEAHAFGNVVTEDLNQAIEEASGRSFDPFFDQWVYHGGFPMLDVSYRWDARNKLARVSVKQTQEVNDKVLLFGFPLKVRFVGKGWTVDHDVEISEREHDFYVPLLDAPSIVRVDPEQTLLAKVKFNPPAEMIYAQLTNKDDALGRVIACRMLADRKDQKTISELKKALNGDAFHGVREAAAEALGGMRTDEALAALVESCEQPDARVRREVVQQIGRVYGGLSLATAKSCLDGEKNPEVAATAIRSLGKYPADAKSNELIQNALNSDTYNQVLASAAIDAIRAQDDPRWIEPLRKMLAEREKDFTNGRSYASALGTLGYIARNEDDKTEVREFLKSHLESPRDTVRIGAVAALGELRDPSAIAVVESAAIAMDARGARRITESALSNLRESKSIPVEMRDLRSEVLDLQKQNEEMQKELESLKQRIEAGAGEGAGENKRERRKLLGIF